MSQKPKIKFLTIQIVNGALIGGVSVFLIVVLSIKKNMFFDYNDQNVFRFIAPIFLIFGYFVGSFLYKKITNKINKADDMQTKLSKYLSATIVRGALLEAAALVGIVGTFTTANYYYLIFAGIALVIMIFYFPNTDKFSQLLNLDFEEKQQLKNL